MLPPAILNATIPKYYMGFGLFMARENLSKTYSWVAFLTAFIIAELPFALLMTVVYYVVWYFPVGLPLGNGAGLSFIMTLPLDSNMGITSSFGEDSSLVNFLLLAVVEANMT